MIAALIYALTKDLWEQVLNKVVSTCIETNAINTSAKIKIFHRQDANLMHWKNKYKIIKNFKIKILLSFILKNMID